MKRRLEEPFGKAGLTVAVIALVFAMLGGAYAASNSSDGGKATASAKAKKGPRGPKGPKGDTGPAGPAGAKGDKGDTGAAGAAGKDGAPGAQGAQGAAGAQGKQGTTGAPGAPGTPGKDGEDGVCSQANPECVMPSKATFTGTWSIEQSAVKGTDAPATASGSDAISFPLRYPGATLFDVQYVKTEGEFEEEGCPGTTTKPDADAGFLCIYQSSLSSAMVGSIVYNEVFTENPIAEAISSSGTTLFLQSEPQPVGDESIYPAFSAHGSWAVTAP